MLPDSITEGLARHAVTIIGGYLISKGKLDPTSANSIAGGIVALVGVAWSIWHKRRTTTAINTALALPPSSDKATLKDALKAA